MMHPIDDLDEILAELRQEYRTVEPPASLERHLAEQTQLLAPPSRFVHRTQLRAWGLSFALIALLAAAVAVWQLSRAPKAPETHATTPSAPAPNQSLSQQAPLRLSATPKTSHNRAPRVVAAKANPNPGSPGRFVTLPASEGLPAPTLASLVRTRIQTSSLRQYGLDVPASDAPQTVLAEFLIGEDDLPRAVRLLP